MKYRKYLTCNYISWNGFNNLHTSTHKINKTHIIFYLRNDNRMTLELPPSSQPWPGTVPGSKSDTPELAPTCKRSRTPKDETVGVWKLGSVLFKCWFGNSLQSHPGIIIRSPKPSLSFLFIDNIWKNGNWFNFSWINILLFSWK